MTDLIANYLETGAEIAGLEREVALNWLAQIQSKLSGIAAEAETSVKEFACTLLIAIVGTESAAFIQVGDGAMVVREEGDDGWSYVFWPQHGEYINSTNFVTSPDAAAAMEFACVNRKVVSISSFSDGIESLVLNYATKTVHDPFFNAMIGPVREVATEGLDHGLSESLARYLGSDRICERTDDDKSLVIATCVPSTSSDTNAAT